MLRQCLMIVFIKGLVQGANIGKVAWFDPNSALHMDKSADQGSSCSPRSVGSWAERLGAVAPEMEPGENVPVADVLWPLDTLTLLVLPLKNSDEIATFTSSSHNDKSVWLSTLTTSTLNANDYDEGMIMCDERHLSEEDSSLSEFALRRLIQNPESHPLAAAIVSHGGSVSASFIQGRNDAPGLEIENSEENRQLVGDLALLVENAYIERGQREARILQAPSIDQVSSRSAALALLDATTRAIASAQNHRRTATAFAFIGKQEIDSLPSPLNKRKLDDSTTTYYPISDIRQFQLNMWTGIALVLVLAAALAAMVNMKPEYDSLLYATFQANVSGGGLSKIE
uniref:Uncharacterized protein n=1 Tax=Aureoumbra lagunensis TaxID=44058 RepID=A0A7S3JQS7_9STRA|mmetsp:Transcript_11121/g.15319  ORF Transcript_11121/g.15319 Transcript_11121/m.15319 type:complete len:341 (+) Transcript_11121:40-1062(+)